jgi:hypothetical protein
VGIASAVAEATKAMRDKSCMIECSTESASKVGLGEDMNLKRTRPVSYIVEGKRVRSPWSGA